MIVYHVPSFTTPGEHYRVVRDGDDWVCSCPRYDFSKAGAKGCKHTVVVRQADAILQRCGELHGVDPDGKLCRHCFVAVFALMTGKAKRRIGEAVRDGKRQAREQARLRKRRTASPYDLSVGKKGFQV